MDILSSLVIVAISLVISTSEPSFNISKNGNDGGISPVRTMQKTLPALCLKTGPITDPTGESSPL